MTSVAFRPLSALDGHQLRSPKSQVSAGTQIERTRNVSSSTPSATAKPIRLRSQLGMIVSTAKVPARIRPALVITGPVAATALTRAFARAVARRLLAHAAHQEDVVVRPESDEEDEDDQRHRRVEAVLAEDEREDRHRQAERGGVREDDRREQEERRHERPQEQDQRRQHDEEDERDDHLRVAALRDARVEALGGPVSDEDVDAGDRVRDGRL